MFFFLHLHYTGWLAAAVLEDCSLNIHYIPVLLFPVKSIFASSPLTNLCHVFRLTQILLISQNVQHHIRHIHLRRHSPPWCSAMMRASLLPFLPLFCPSLRSPTIPAPSLTATVSPPPPSALHCECLVQQPQPLLQYMQPRLAFAEQPEPNAAQRPVWAQRRGREALQTADPARKTRQYWLPSSSTGCANPNVRWHLLICFFKAEIHLSSPVSALVCRLTHIPWFTLGKQQIC